MHKLTRLLAWRYIIGTAYEQRISTMVAICFVSIVIGSGALALVTAITHGFETAIHEKMQGIHANLIIRAYGQPLDTTTLLPVLHKEFPQLTISPSSTEHALIQAEHEDGQPAVVVLKAIDPHKEILVSTLHKKIVWPKTASTNMLAHILKNNSILIGKALARDLQVSVGETVQLLHTDQAQQRGRRITFNATDVTIGGIFDTGIDEFDTSIVFCSFALLAQLFPASAVTQLNGALATGTHEQQLISQLRTRTGLEVYSWKELYPALVSALALEEYATFCVIALIALVACMNIIALLFMHITQKRPDIAILKAMGTPDSIIMQIFMLMGVSIAGAAALCGITLAWFVCMLLQRYPFIQLPDAYYVTHLPAQMTWSIALATFAVVLVMSALATWLAARKTKAIKPAQVLRFEG